MARKEREEVFEGLCRTAGPGWESQGTMLSTITAHWPVLLGVVLALVAFALVLVVAKAPKQTPRTPAETYFQDPKTGTKKKCVCSGIYLLSAGKL